MRGRCSNRLVPYRPCSDPRTMAALLRLGLAISQARRLTGLSQTRLARRSGVDQGSISRLERGLAPGMRIENIARILDIVGSLNVPDQRTLDAARWNRGPG